jgi:hypothetical protein
MRSRSVLLEIRAVFLISARMGVALNLMLCAVLTKSIVAPRDILVGVENVIVRLPVTH